jgi:hypothetical protein
MYQSSLFKITIETTIATLFMNHFNSICEILYEVQMQKIYMLLYFLFISL